MVSQIFTLETVMYRDYRRTTRYCHTSQYIISLHVYSDTHRIARYLPIHTPTLKRLDMVILTCRVINDWEIPQPTVDVVVYKQPSTGIQPSHIQLSHDLPSDVAYSETHTGPLHASAGLAYII